MAIIKDGKELYAGQVFNIREHHWMDGMVEEFAEIWDSEAHEVKSVQVGYYGSDYQNLCGDIDVTLDLSYANYVDMHKTYAQMAKVAWAKHVEDFKAEVMKGRRARVIRGRKVPVGTELDIFWIGERETFQSRKYPWLHQYEEIAGGLDDNGNKVYIKKEYLENITIVPEPTIEEKKEWVRRWYSNNIPTTRYYT